MLQKFDLRKNTKNVLSKYDTVFLYWWAHGQKTHGTEDYRRHLKNVSLNL